MRLLAVPPSKIQNKALPRYELGRYFDVRSAESLILALRQGQRNGYFTFDVTLSPEFFVHQKDKYDLLSGKTESFTPLAPLGMATYGLRNHSKKALSAAEVRDIMRDFSSDEIEQYLLFTLHHIDYKKLQRIVKPKTQQVDKDEDYDTVEYNGLVAKGAKISYLNQPIYMGFQYRQLVRLLIEKQGGLCYKDEFVARQADIFTADEYKNDVVTDNLRKLINEVRKKLKAADEKISVKNVRSEGWYLEITP